MAGSRVSGITLGLSPNQPTGITSASTNAAKVTAYEAVAGFVYADTCIITQLPSFEEMWQMGQDPLTVCNNPEEIRKQFKIRPEISDSLFAAIFVPADPIIALFDTLYNDAEGVGTLELTHANGTDILWVQVQIKTRKESYDDIENKVMYEAGIVVEERPVRNY